MAWREGEWVAPPASALLRHPLRSIPLGAPKSADFGEGWGGANNLE